MKIAILQSNPVIGDFSGNREKIIAAVRSAEQAGCELAIFPELALSGYPPQDLLERRSFLTAHDTALADLCRELPSIDVLLGCIEQRRQADGGKPLCNSAFLLSEGEVLRKVRKQLLPTYDVFDEKRYFQPGDASQVIHWKGLQLGVTICEDIWHSVIGEYGSDPVARLFAENEKLDCLINISASPFQRNKEGVRHKLFQSICCRYQVPLIYVNQVGGQDSLLFDGRSLLMDATGQIRGKCYGFTEDMLVVETDDWSSQLHEAAEEDSLAAVHDALVMGIRDYVGKCGFTSVVLGLSGGIDSALCAALAVEALGAENVLGVALPSPYSSTDSLEDAKALAANLGCGFEVIPISDLFAAFQGSLKNVFAGSPEDVTEQNLQARIRGNLLMALSNKFGHLLLSTGNKSEMAVGYCTLYGDMNGGLAVISDVPKQLVYELSLFINRKEERIPSRSITKAPTAELKEDQCDQDDLPDYAILDQILELHLEEHLGCDEIVDKGFDRKLVADIVRRVRLNEYKRKQAPMGLKVTGKAFGCGRRYPNVQNFQD